MITVSPRYSWFIAPVLGLLAQACSEPAALEDPPVLARGGPPSTIPAIFALADPMDGGSTVVSDGRDANGDGTSDAYIHDVCGVGATISDGTAYLDPDSKTISRKQADSCGGQSPRYIQLRFTSLASGSGTIETVQTPGVMKVNDIGTVAIGAVELRSGGINNGKCGLLAFNGEGGSSLFSVFRGGPDSFTVSLSGSQDLGYCRDEASLWHMPFQVLIQAK